MRILSVSRAVSVAYVLVATSTAHSDELVAKTRATTWHERAGLSLSLGGGIDDFVSEGLRARTSLGGSWNIRATLGTHSVVGGEASYIGSAQSIDALGLDDDAILVGNGAQAALRLNGTFNLPVQPFIFGGAAWRRYDLTNADFNTSAVRDSDDVLEIPVGLGIAGKWSGLVLDVRGEFRPTLDNDLIPTFGPDNDEDIGNDDFAAMHRWGVNASIGYEF